MAKTTIEQFEAYSVTNLLNGKTYVGITTVGIDRRWAQHLEASRCRRKNAIHRAIAKHGAENFRIDVIGVAGTWAELCAIERRLIDELKSLSPAGYNMTSGGDGMFAPSDDVRAMMSEKARVRTSTPEARAAYGAKSVASWSVSPEVRAARGAAMKAGKAKPEVQAAMSKRMLAQWAASPERRKELSERNLERMSSPEARAAYGERMRAYFAANPEAAKAQSERMLARSSTPEARAAQSALAKKQMACPEARAVKVAQLRAGKARARAARLAKDYDTTLI